MSSSRFARVCFHLQKNSLKTNSTDLLGKANILNSKTHIQLSLSSLLCGCAEITLLELSLYSTKSETMKKHASFLAYSIVFHVRFSEHVRISFIHSVFPVWLSWVSHSRVLYITTPKTATKSLIQVSKNIRGLGGLH